VNIKSKMAAGYRNLQGGLFSTVSKADVGTSLLKYIESGANLLCWADPFYPDHVVPDFVESAVINEVKCGMAAHYTMPVGNTELKKEIARKLALKNGLNVNWERNIIITPGSDSGLLFSMMPFICPGDEVMVPDPSYPNNSLNPKLLGGVTIPVPLHEDDNYQIDIKEFQKRLTPRTKMVVITNPNNPTATVFRRESLEKLAEFIIDNDLILVVDQAFEDLIYDGIEYVSIAALPGMWERTVTVFSISKGMALSGYRVGYIVADDKIMDIMYGCAVSILGATNTASQIGAIAAMKDRSFIKGYEEIFERRRRKVTEVFNSIPGVSMKMPESSFLSWVNVSKLGSGNEICEYIAKEANVIVNDGSLYGENGRGYLRIVFGCYKDDDVLYEALDRMKNALSRLAMQKRFSFL
jgi:aspartate/methionine/tyrosine aminotransferase